jgi:TPP-dependent pyruvate/acetoin dehydrogenase alpha subunit
MALAEKLKETGVLTVVFLGDGTMGEGVLYEALNMASLWGAPVLFVIENNQIAQTTPIELAVAGSIPARFEAFGIPAQELDTSDVCEILPAAKKLMAEVRGEGRPRALVLHTYRFGPHSKGDDRRDEAELAEIKARRDPITIQGDRLDEKERKKIDDDLSEQVAAAYEQAKADPQAASA